MGVVHAGELTKLRKGWPENPISRRLPVTRSFCGATERTVITSTLGPLLGRGMVRGREGGMRRILPHHQPTQQPVENLVEFSICEDG